MCFPSKKLSHLKASNSAAKIFVLNIDFLIYLFIKNNGGGGLGVYMSIPFQIFNIDFLIYFF